LASPAQRVATKRYRQTAEYKRRHRERQMEWQRLNREKYLAQQAKQRATRNSAQRLLATALNRVRRYGLSLNSYLDLLYKQDFRCAICACTSDQAKAKMAKRESLDGFVVDHCHRTNRVRGLLCQPCNAGLGMFQDSTTALTQAAKYLLEK